MYVHVHVHILKMLTIFFFNFQFILMAAKINMPYHHLICGY